MQAVILAAGAGKRLEKVSNGFPKAMLRIGSKSIIQNQIEQCLKFGVSRFVFVIGFQKEILRQHINRLLHGMEIVYIENDRYEETNTLYSLYLAREYFTEPFLYFNSDVYFRDGLLSRFDLNSVNSQLLLKKGQCSDEEVKIITDERDRVLEIGKGLLAEQCAGEFIGIGYFVRDDLSIFQNLLEQGIIQNQEKNYFEWALNVMCKEKKIIAVNVNEEDCLEIDFPHDLTKARQLFA